MSLLLWKAIRDLKEAYNMTIFDLTVVGLLTYRSKRNHLCAAQSKIQQVHMMQQRLPCDVRCLGEVSIASGSFWSHSVFTTNFTQRDMQKEVHKSIDKVKSALMLCENMIRERHMGLRELQREVTGAEEEMRRARVQLQRVREDAFTRVVGASGPPAGYTA
ncbi:hypothetical protein ACEQ8H_003444 [Pleosporales sp. CAS-2024a]